MLRFRFAGLLFATLLVPLVSAAEPLRLLGITPSGENVPPGRQIVLQFDRPVVPVGRMDRDPSEIPIRIEPPLSCEWRWLNTSALACQLGEEDALRPATRYELRIEPGLRTEAGETLAETVVHGFETELPQAEHAGFETWRSPGTPDIVVTFNQPIQRESVEAHLDFAGKGGRLQSLAARLPDPEEDSEPSSRWVVSPTEELPLGQEIVLWSRAGLRSAAGPLASRLEEAVVAFRTYPEQRFLGVRCSDLQGEEIEIPVDGPPPSLRCNPMSPVEVRFTSPIDKEVLRTQLGVSPDLAGGRDDYDPWDEIHAWYSLEWAGQADRGFTIHLPVPLLSRSAYRLRGTAAELRDVFDRPLPADLDFTFLTGDRPPRAVLTHPVSVLEKGVETHVPAVVTNLARIGATTKQLTPEGSVSDDHWADVPAALNVAFKFPLRIREWLGGRSGALFGRLRTEPDLAGGDRYLFSQVTPFHVHVKVGHTGTLVWVTDLASGLPVQGARVRIYTDRIQELDPEPEALTEATTRADGVALLAGAPELDPSLKLLRWSSLAWRRNYTHLFLRVDHAGEMALVPLTGDFIVDARGPGGSWIWENLRPQHGHIHTWGTTAQGVYRVGDTIQFTLFVRDQDARRFVPAPRDGYTLQVVDPMGKVAHQVEDLELSEFGSFAGEFELAESAPVGWYRFQLVPDFVPHTNWEPMRVLVADFTPAPFRVTTDVDGELFEAEDDVEVTTLAKLHAGGPYADADARVTATLRATPLRFDAPALQGFFFQAGETGPETLHQSEDRVDESGELETEFRLPESTVIHGRLRFESAVRDDRGKYVSGFASARYVARDRFVGIRQGDWLLSSGEPTTVEAMVVDADGDPVRFVRVETLVEFRDTKASRVKGAGNAYLTRTSHEWVIVHECSERSGGSPTSCAFTPEEPGYYRLTAKIEDGEGRPHESTTTRWATGRGHVIWDTDAGHHLEILPEKTGYVVGDTARFLVQNPFPGARALISVERLGVQESWQRTLEESSELIELEIEEDHLPGFYLSVVITSPRVEAAPADGAVDLGKPALRMGYVRVPVKDPAKELTVEVVPERERYRPRETVRVELAARTRTDETPPMEIAVAVLDEAVFDLISDGRRYFDPYEGFYTLDPLDLRNYNLLTHLVGIQKFAAKGANPGGGGGAGPELRSISKFVSYWNPSVRTDGQGRASIEFEVPDNLTGWRVLAMAVTREDRMGLGEGTFVVNRPTEIRPALPNQVTEGDEFLARFTVMNRTDEKRTLRVDATVTGAAESAGLQGESVTAKPFKRQLVSVPVRATDPGEIRFVVTAGDDRDADAVELHVPVRRRQALEAAANYGSTTDPAVEERLHFPEAIRTDVGRVSVVAGPSVIAGVGGAFRYMAGYPYTCWEQRLTKAVMASHYGRLRAYLPDDVTWKDHESLPETTLGEAADFQAPNGGMVYWVAEDRYVSPYLSAYTALAFAWLRERGHAVPATVEDGLHEYLRTLLRRDVFPEFYSPGMESSVRAVALAALALRGGIERADLDRHRPHVPKMDLFGKAHFLMAASALDGTKALRTEVRNAILSHANQTGGKFVFGESIDTGYQRILHSELRSQCAILSALVREQGGVPTGAAIGDVPFKLTRTITQTRKRKDRWESTQENVFCMNGLVDYSGVYESEAPAFTLEVKLDGESLGSARFEDIRAESVEMERPLREGDPGRKTSLHLTKEGPGRLYWATRLFFSPIELKKDPVNAGIEVRREYHVERDGEWKLLGNEAEIRQGDLVRVDLFVSLPAARNFVVVDDPVPGGLEPVNRDLATASEVDVAKGAHVRSDSSWWFHHSDWRTFGYSRWSFYHAELRHHAARFYSEWLPAGNYHLSYVAQAIAPGTFEMLPLHAEEMYDPDVFGQGVPGRLRIEATE